MRTHTVFSSYTNIFINTRIVVYIWLHYHRYIKFHHSFIHPPTILTSLCSSLLHHVLTNEVIPSSSETIMISTIQYHNHQPKKVPINNIMKRRRGYPCSISLSYIDHNFSSTPQIEPKSSWLESSSSSASITHPFKLK